MSWIKVLLPWCFHDLLGVTVCIEMCSSRRPAPKIAAQISTTFSWGVAHNLRGGLGDMGRKEGWFHHFHGGFKAHKLRSLKLFPPPGLLIVLGGVGAWRGFRRSTWCRWSFVVVVVVAGGGGGGGGGFCFLRDVGWDEAGRQIWIQHAINQNQQVGSYLVQAKAHILHEMILNVNDFSSVDLSTVSQNAETPPRRSWLWWIHPSVFEVHWRGSGQLQTRWGAEDFLPPAPFQKVSWMLHLMACDVADNVVMFGGF